LLGVAFLVVEAMEDNNVAGAKEILTPSIEVVL
jgi:hypothetical protein